MVDLPVDFLTVCLAAFAGGLVDAMVGGGGLIQLPALFSTYTNTAPAALLGTSKFAGVFGTTSAVIRFAGKVVIPWRALLPLAVLVMAMAAVGAFAATHVPPDVFRPLVPVLLVSVLIYLVRRKELGAVHAPRGFAGPHHKVGLPLIGTVGFYDGFFGPGTGSFLMFLFVRFYGYDFLNAAASARVLNVATNLAALAYFGTHGHVIWYMGVGLAVCNVAGSIVGVRLALAGGAALVRNAFILVVSALILRTTWTALQ